MSQTKQDDVAPPNGCNSCGAAGGHKHDPDCVHYVPFKEMGRWRQGIHDMRDGALIDTKGLTGPQADAYLMGVRLAEKEMAAERTKQLTRAAAPGL